MEDKKKANWTFLTNHAHVLLCLSKDIDLRIRDLAQQVGITERAVLRILAELTEDNYLERTKEGRRNIYRLKVNKPLKHPVEAHKNVEDLIKLIDK